MQDAFWIPRNENRDLELQRPVLYAPSPCELPVDPPDQEPEAEAESSERVVIIEI